MKKNSPVPAVKDIVKKFNKELNGYYHIVFGNKFLKEIVLILLSNKSKINDIAEFLVAELMTQQVILNVH